MLNMSLIQLIRTSKATHWRHVTISKNISLLHPLLSHWIGCILLVGLATGRVAELDKTVGKTSCQFISGRHALRHLSPSAPSSPEVHSTSWKYGKNWESGYVMYVMYVMYLMYVMYVMVWAKITVVSSWKSVDHWWFIGSGIVLGISFFRFVFWGGSAFLPVFLAICSILELEASISTVFTTFWSSNLSFSIVLATCWCSNSSCCMVFCDWGSFKVGLRLV